jgi:hypothetical protein
MALKNRLAQLTAHPDKLTETGNFIALVLAWNAPFYPFYVWLLAGGASLPSSLLTALSLPVMAAVPAVSRRSGLAARVLLCLAGTGNTVWCGWVLGEPAGVALFLLPCIMLASLLFRAGEWPAYAPLVALPMLCGWFLPGRLPAPPHVYTATQYGHLLNMNAASVAVLIAFIGYAFARQRDAAATGVTN